MGCSSSSAPSKEGGAGNGNTDGKDKKQAKDENANFQSKLMCLKNVSLLKSLPNDQLPIVAKEMTSHSFDRGQKVISQDEMGDELFIIKEGEAAVSINTEGKDGIVAKLKAGDYFGENALLRNEPRQATIIAESKLVCFKITRSNFQKLGLQTQLTFGNRKAFFCGRQAEAKSKKPSTKDERDYTLISNALKSNDNLKVMTSMDDSRCRKLADLMWEENVGTGDDIITEGDMQNAFYFYIVKDGNFEIWQSNSPDQQDGRNLGDLMQSKMLSSVGKGGSFGELALLYLVPRAATVKAKTSSVVWVIDRDQFKKTLMPISESKLKQHVNVLNSVGILDSLIHEEKRALAEEFTEMQFKKAEEIVRQGEPGNTFYILYEGKCDVIRDGEIVSQLSADSSHEKAVFFGERALLGSDVREATVKVSSTTAKTLTLDRDKFNTLLGPLKDLMERSKDKAGPDTSSWKGGKILRKDLLLVGLLGCGGFGKVDMYEHKETGATYAMKALSKGYIVKTGMQDSVMNEKFILMMTNSDFIVKLYETYNGTQSLYFLLELALGGELYATYNRKGLHGSEKHAKYYAAGVTFAFEHLHERNVIYRDLKPENLLLTDKGHIKLTDMGLAKFVIGKTYTTCGTPDYFAPELIASTGHTKAVDWWTLGVLVFELMSGHPPFESAYPMQIYTKVMKGINKVTMPQKCQGHTGDLIRALLKNEPNERLAVKSGGIQNVKNHKFFEGFDWQGMKELSLYPPYEPVVKSKKDLANFCARKEDAPRQLEYRDPGTGWDRDF